MGIISILVRQDFSKTRLLVGTTRQNLSLQIAFWASWIRPVRVAVNTILERLRSLEHQRLQHILVQLSVQTTGLYCYVCHLYITVGGQVRRLFHSAFWSMNKNSITHICQAANRITVQYHLFLICPARRVTTPLLLDSFPHLIPLKSVFWLFFYRPVVFLCLFLLYNLSALDKSRGATVNGIKNSAALDLLYEFNLQNELMVIL
jgi:hypothetical protein